MSITSFVDWVKNNKIAALIILLLLIYVAYRDFFGLLGIRQYALYDGGYGEFAPGLEDVTEALPGVEETPTTKERLVVQESNISLVVKDVSETAAEVVSYAEREGGFMVSSSITRPEESPVATVIVRVPAQKLKAVMAYLRSLAIKVSSEKLVGTDVTEEYENIEAKIDTLEKTITRFEAIRAKATKVSELLEVTREIINLQKQIDTLRGRKKYLEDTAAFAKITAYLATDEFALPYQPPAGFRPGVVFKQAVRALLTNIYAIGRAFIWIGVYGVIWVPALAIIIHFRRRKRPSKSS